MYKYLGQCDKLRSKGLEPQWQAMMTAKQPIEQAEFYLDCDRQSLANILDYESYPVFTPLSDILCEFVADDPDHGFYKSMWGDRPCMFIQTSGFEFIFISD